jgi:hypothetical protein
VDTVRPKAIGVRSAWARRGRSPGLVRLAPARGAAAQIGTRVTADLSISQQTWSDWLGSGRVRKFAMVAEKQ